LECSEEQVVEEEEELEEQVVKEVLRAQAELEEVVQEGVVQ